MCSDNNKIVFTTEIGEVVGANPDGDGHGRQRAAVGQQGPPLGLFTGLIQIECEYTTPLISASMAAHVAAAL